MKISLNEIKKYVEIPAEISDQELIELIGSRLVEIEEVIDLAPKYQGIYVVKVVSAEKIPDTHLTLCQVDAGSERQDLAKDGLIQVVCGAPNVHAGMFAVWLAPGTVVPSTYGNENFKLGTRKLQGHESNGMLAAIDELDLGTDHEGIAEVNPKMATPGANFAELFELNDLILDVENKSLTHRPDCFGLIGFAREVAGILGLKFEEPYWPEIEPAKKLPLKVSVADASICARYSCAVFDLPKYPKEHYLTYYGDVFLAKAGMRAIDPMVDLTNIIMLRTGQPLHAFDYDKLVGVGGTETPEIIVRTAKEGEELQLLDGKTIQCTPDDILITSNNVPVALAGAMGGKNTEIDASTTRVILESATFSLYHLRKTQMAHGIFSEAITRFTKGQPAAMTLPVLAETVAELHVEPLAVVDKYLESKVRKPIDFTTFATNSLLGTDFTADTIRTTLGNVGFEFVESRAKNLRVIPPKWRTDIHIPEDVIEEVGRLQGYDNIELTLPQKPFSGTEIAPMWQFKSELRNILSDRLNLHELLTYSFVSRNLLEKAGQDAEASYKIVNSISPELQCFRQQIVPSLLDKVRENIKAGHKDFSLYEMNQVTNRDLGLDEDNVPILENHLGIVSLCDYYSIKALLFAAIERGLHIDLEYKQMALGSEAAQKYPYLEPAHSVELFVGYQRIGAMGEVKESVRRKFKLDTIVSAAEVELDQLIQQERITQVHVKLSKFPSVERDITLQVTTDTPFGRIHEAVREALDQENLFYDVTPLSVYQPADSNQKNLSFHLKFASPEQTLDAAQITAIMDKITVVTTQIGAKTI